MRRTHCFHGCEHTKTWNLGYRFKEFRNEKQRNEPQNIWISLDCGITHGNIHMNYPGE